MIISKSTINPSKLYRYVPFNDRLKSIIIDNRIYFSSPNDYNDPFDCSISVIAEGSEDEQRDYFERLCKKYNPLITVFELSKMLNNAKTIDWNQFFKENQQKLKDKLGVLSLSAKSDSMLMWTHYADEHNGVCLEFSVDSKNPFFVDAFQIEYSVDYPKINYSENDRDKLLKTLLVKSQDWAYEEEWRIINFDSGPGLHTFSPCLLTGIIFGLATKQENHSILQSWIAKGKTTPILYKAFKNNDSFGLNIKKLTNQSS